MSVTKIEQCILDESMIIRIKAIERHGGRSLRCWCPSDQVVGNGLRAVSKEIRLSQKRLENSCGRDMRQAIIV